MKWNQLTDSNQLDAISIASQTQPILIFKHSTRCSISNTALSRLERNWKEEDATILAPYYLDLLTYRSISNDIESKFKVEHQSPQILIIKNGQCVFTQSHLEISYQDIVATSEK